MAKTKSKKAKSTVPKKAAKPKLLPKSFLIPSAAATSTAANVGITFTSGAGQATATLFRKGLLINMQSVNSSSSIHFSDVQRGDTVSINGVCTGTATISISVPTSPDTPDNFGAGNINTGYDIL